MARISWLTTLSLLVSLPQLAQAEDLCQVLTVGPGPEDFVVDSRSGDIPRLLISSQNRRQGHLDDPGAIYASPLLYPNLGPAQQLEMVGLEGPFHPHGIDMIHSPRGPLLYVVNHHSEESHAIERFVVEGMTLRHEKTYLNTTHLFHPNDIVVLSEEEFYVSNDHEIPMGARQTIGDLFGVRKSNVVHHKSGEWQKVADKIAYANGVEISADEKTFYVAGVRDKKVHVYDRDPQSGQLTKSDLKFKMRAGPDNLLWQDEKHLITAAHPSIFKFIGHFYNEEKHAPSAVYQMNTESGEVREVYRDDGRVIDASTTGLIYKNAVIIGQVSDPEVVICQLQD